jgi:hypothetical protein
MLDLVFEPVGFFRTRRYQAIPWSRALVAPVLCVVLHATAYALLSRKTVALALEVTPPPEGAADAAYSFIRTASVALPLLSALVYLSIWLVATAMLVCIDILGRDEVRGVQLLKLTGLAYYCLVPYLLVTLVLAATFHPPAAADIALAAEPAEVARNLRAAIQDTATISIIRQFGYLFHGWLVALFVCAYRACSQVRRSAAVAIALFLYSSLFLVHAALD